jgi:hypothetical protein
MYAAKEDEALAAVYERDSSIGMWWPQRSMHTVHAIPVVRAASPGALDLADVAGFVGGVHEFEK